MPETPYSKSQSDPEVGNTRHFENGIEGGLKFFADDPLVAQPGTHFNYSTQGYTLVGTMGVNYRAYSCFIQRRLGLLRKTRTSDRVSIRYVSSP